MPSTISQRASNQTKNATDKSDVTIFLKKTVSGGATGTTPGTNGLVGIAKTFNFNVTKPKSPIYVLSQSDPVGFARDPIDRTFSMTELSTFENIEDIGQFTGAGTPFMIQLAHAGKNEAGESVTKVIQLDGVEFDTVDYSIDAGTSEYVWNFSGKFTSGLITGELRTDLFDPETGTSSTLSGVPL